MTLTSLEQNASADIEPMTYYIGVLNLEVMEKAVKYNLIVSARRCG